MKNWMNKKIMILVMILFFLSSFGVSYAFWASSVQGINQEGSGTISIGNWYIGVTQNGGNGNIRLDQIGSTGYELHKDFVLLSDITWSGAFTPIGYNAQNQTTTPFTGNFAGNGFSISNISITSNGAYDYAGLFAINGGTIHGVSLINFRINHSRTISNPVNPSLIAGGIAGENLTTGIIMNSYVSGSGTNNINVSLTSTSNRNNATYSAVTHAGGLVGINRGAIKDSHANIAVSASNHMSTGSNKNDFTVNTFAGGLVGENLNNQGIIYTYATGNVTALASTTFTGNNNDSSIAYAHSGGLVGKNSANATGVAYSFATGNVVATINRAGNSNIDTRINYFGGLVGLGGSTQSYRPDSNSGQSVTATGGVPNTINLTGGTTPISNFRSELWVISNQNLSWSIEIWSFDGINYPRLKNNKY